MGKVISFVLGLVMVLVMCGVGFGAVGDNVIVNGNLDTLAGWGGWGPSAATTPIGKIELNTTGYQGNCGRVVTSAQGHWILIQRSNTIPFADYDVSCWIKSTVPFEIVSVWDGTPDGWKANQLVMETAAISTWKNYNLTFKAMETTTQILFQITNSAGTLDVDSVTCVQKTTPDTYITSMTTLANDTTKLETEKSEAYLCLGMYEYYKKNYTQALVWFGKLANQKAIVNTYIASAKDKEKLKDWQGAFNDYDNAFANCSRDDENLTKTILSNMKAIEARLK